VNRMPFEIARDKRAQSPTRNLSEGSRSEALSERSAAAPELAAPLSTTQLLTPTLSPYRGATAFTEVIPLGKGM
jgi:hypothetical protein